MRHGLGRLVRLAALAKQQRKLIVSFRQIRLQREGHDHFASTRNFEKPINAKLTMLSRGVHALKSLVIASLDALIMVRVQSCEYAEEANCPSKN